MSSDVNSQAYWDTRFKTDWLPNGGGEQTRFFNGLAVDLMPEWFRDQLRSQQLTLCDWGCGMGDGVPVLAERLGVQVTGVDFAPAAIKQAKAAHPGYSFVAQDWTLHPAPKPLYDVVFSSNTLEHFTDPWGVFRQLAQRARHYVALLLPYRERDRHPEHFASFGPQDILLEREGWTLLHAAHMDVSIEARAQWPGEQILLIYGRGSRSAGVNLHLGNARFDTAHADVNKPDFIMERLASGIGASQDALSRKLARDHDDVIRAISGDIQHMQGMLVEAREQAAAAEARADLTGVLGNVDAAQAQVLGAVREQHADLIRVLSEDIRRMQDMVAQARSEAAAAEARAQSAAIVEETRVAAVAGLADVRDAHGNLVATVRQNHTELVNLLDHRGYPLPAELGSRLDELDSRIQSQHADVIRSLSDDIRVMQSQVVEARSSAARDAVLAQQAAALAPQIELLARGQDERLQHMHDQMQQLRTLVESGATWSGQALGVVNALFSDARAKDAMLAHLHAQVCTAIERDEHHEAERASLIDRHARELAQAMRESEAHSVASAAASAEVAKLNGEIPALRAHLDAQARVIENLRGQLAEQDRHSRELGETLAVISAELEKEQEQRRQEAVLRGAADHERTLIFRSASWRLTRPLRVAKRLVTGRFGAADVNAARRLLGLPPRLIPSVAVVGALEQPTAGHEIANPSATAESEPVYATLDPVEPHHETETRTQATPISVWNEVSADDAGLPDVFIWSVIDYHLRIQRPQHLARALAEKGHRVYYISVRFWDVARPGFHLDPLGVEGRLNQIHLHLEGEPSIYSHVPSDAEVEAMRSSLVELLAWTRSTSSISIVQHPFWHVLARAVPNARLIYDCMDHHEGFEDNAPHLLQAEGALCGDADLVVVTSDWLEERMRERARATALVRNATEYARFATVPTDVFRAAPGQKIIGYYGAIAAWFDAALVRRVAKAHPEALVVLVGHDTSNAGEALADLPNVTMVGEVPYDTLPYWLHGFDVCLLPFKVLPLTLATNPVKVYEYLAAGKPVVAVDLPEMTQFGGLVRTADDAEAFISQVTAALDERQTAEVVGQRQAFARQQTWEHRARELDAAIDALGEPLVSVVVLAYNNLGYTTSCLQSIERYSDYANLEIIVVDNASTDGTQAAMTEWAATPSRAGHSRRYIRNATNAGFAAGNNIGLAQARGDYLVILNNDTHVTPGWVRTLRSHLQRDASLGLVGPVTNNIGNEARIELAYPDMGTMIALAGEYTRRHPGVLLPMDTVAFFCTMLPRRVYSVIGGLDERFGLGFFEDDDYCRRVQAHGWRVGCAEDAFVHHHLSASFDAIGSDRKRALFLRNKAAYEEKWGVWKPHRHRPAETT